MCPGVDMHSISRFVRRSGREQQSKEVFAYPEGAVIAQAVYTAGIVSGNCLSYCTVRIQVG